MLDRMRALKGSALTTVLIFAICFTARGVSLSAKEAVNYDDPNLAFTSNYVGDTAASCPKTLKGNDLRACLVQNGLAIGATHFDDPADVLVEAAKTTQPKDDSGSSIR